MRLSFTALALGLTVGGCAAASSGAGAALRHAGRVDAIVIRSLDVQPGVTLEGPALRAVRREAVRGVAEAVDDLPAETVESLRLDIDLPELSTRGGATRARCLITVSTIGPPERTRSILQGAATVRAHEHPAEAAATAAVRAALRRLPQALSAL